MLRITGFTFNPFQENTYVLHNEQGACWIIDPGMFNADEEKVLLDFLTREKLRPRQIINTHTHIDHILGIHGLKTKFRLPFGMHEDDLPILRNAAGSAMMFGLPAFAAPQADFYIQAGATLNLGQDTVEVRLAPGHSPGSIVFYYPQGGFVVAGDVLFQGSVGRTDLPGGDFSTLSNSIQQQLYTLPDDTLVYPGHGPATTIGKEKRSNPFVRGQ